MTTEQVVGAMRSQLIDEETFIWRDGMDDWLTPFEIPEIARALAEQGLQPTAAPDSQAAEWEEELTRVAVAPSEAKGSPTSVATALPAEERRSGAWREPGRWEPPDAGAGSELSFDDVTVAMAAPTAQELLEATSAPSAAPEPSFEEDEATVVADSARLGLTAEAPPTAPRPAAGIPPEAEPPPPSRPAALRPDRAPEEGSVDLFGQVDRAGSEESEAGRQRMPSVSPEAQGSALTGARNESSVLFSLDQLTQAASTEESGKREDEEALLFGGPSEPDRRREEAAGAPAVPIAAPDFTAPAPPSAPSHAPAPSKGPAARQGGGHGGLWAALLALVLAAGAGGAYFYLKMKRIDSPPADVPASTGPVDTPAPTEPPASQAEEALTATQAPEDETSAAEPAPAPAPSEQLPSSEAAPAESPSSPSPQAAVPTQAAKPSRPDEAPQTASEEDEAEHETKEEKSAAPPFDKAAARSALGAAAATASASCKTPDGPTGTGQVAVTFVESGRATRTIVTGDFAGTATGGCIAKVFRGATVPAFSGSPVRVTKSVSIH